MASPHEKLAESLEVLRALQERGVAAVRSGDLTRTHRERLVKNGFLQEVMKGWYIPVHSDEFTGESTAWYASFWAFFDLLREEPEPSVRVVLGHFVFVYIHPYMDGNGRIGRFLMNVMLAAGGYPWTVIPLGKRDDYMNALESGSVEQDIATFSIFLGRLVSESLEGKQVYNHP